MYFPKPVIIYSEKIKIIKTISVKRSIYMLFVMFFNEKATNEIAVTFIYK